MPRLSIVEQEARLLGRIVQAGDLALQAAEALKPEDFVERKHRAMFRAVADLAARGRVSPVEVAQHPEARKADVSFDDVARLLEEPALEVEVPALIEYLRHQAVRRRLRESAAKLASLCEADMDPDEFEMQAAQLATSVLAELSTEGPPVVSLGDALTGLVAGFGQPERRRRTTIGLPQTLGHHFGGLRAGNLVVLMARPSMGKTAMALQWATSAISMGGARAVFVVSLEMTAEELADRVLQQQTGQSLLAQGVPPEEVRQHLLSELNPALMRLQGWPLYISERRGLRVQDIAVLARRVAAEHGRLDLIVVDYLQLIRIPAARGQNQAAAIGEACRDLRDLAGDLNCPLVLVSQLNRNVELRENKRPVLSDLRDSGNIEEAADVVVSLYREEYYRRDLPSGDPRLGKAEVTVLKYRMGKAPKTFVLGWRPEWQWFEELDEAEVEAYKRAVLGGSGGGAGDDSRRAGAGSAQAHRRVRGGVPARQPQGGAVDGGEGLADAA